MKRDEYGLHMEGGGFVAVSLPPSSNHFDSAAAAVAMAQGLARALGERVQVNNGQNIKFHTAQPTN